MMQDVYLSLGGNMGPVLNRLKGALDQLSSQSEVKNLKVSHFYSTSPVQVESADWFVNAACSFQTSLSIAQVFSIIERIEMQFGKIKKPKNASRLIDIDFLFYGDQMNKQEGLEIPHPRWKERLFVLLPLSDLIQEIFLSHPLGRKHYVLQDLITLLSSSSQKISILEKNPYLQ